MDKETVHTPEDSKSTISGKWNTPVYLVRMMKMNPLNSKWLQLQQIASALQLPTSGTAAVTRQLVEGRLTEMDREPRNVQVVVQGRVRMIQCF